MAEITTYFQHGFRIGLLGLLLLIAACSRLEESQADQAKPSHASGLAIALSLEETDAARSSSKTWPVAECNVLTWVPGPIADAEALTQVGANVAQVWPYPKNGMNACLPPAVIREGLRSGWQQQIKDLHQRGIKVIACTSSVGFIDDIYTTAGLTPSDFYGESPEGGPGIMLGGNFGRNVHVSCLNNPNWLKLQCELADLYGAAGVDGLWYDVGCYADRSVLFCQCKWCQEKWRDHLRQSGLPTNWPLYRPKTATEGETSGDMSDPVKREHLRWRWQCWENFWGTVVQGTKARYPGLRFGHNMGVAETAPGPRCVYLHATTNLYDYVHWEETEHSGPPWSNLCSYLLGRAAGNGKPVVIVQNDVPKRNHWQHRIWMAEGYAAGGVPQTSLNFFDDETKAIFKLARQAPDLFQPLESMAQTAILYSCWSAAIDEVPRNAYSAYWMGQLLIDGHEPFDYLVAERDLNRQTLTRSRTLILPDVTVLRDRELEVLRQYLNQGGRVVVTGRTGSFDESLKPRDHALVQLGKGLPPGRLVILSGTPEKVWWDSHPRNLKDSLAFNPLRKPLEEVIAAVRGDATDSKDFTVQHAAMTTAIMPWRQGNDLLVHLVNYNLYPDAKAITPDRNIIWSWRIPKGLEVDRVTLHAPYQPDADEKIEWTQDSGLLRVKLPELHDYLIVRASTKTSRMQQEGVKP